MVGGKRFGSWPSFNGLNVVLDSDPRLLGNFTATVTVDFGHPAGGEDTTAAVTASIPWVTPSLWLDIQLRGTTPDHGPQDAAVEGITAYISDVGTGWLEITAHAPEGTWGRYSITVTGR